MSAPQHDVEGPQNALSRPRGACCLCMPPMGSKAWRMADSGYLTCSYCAEKLTETLAEIGRRFGELDPSPSRSGDPDSRGPSGFGSRSPASDHVIAMMDHRSKSYEVARDGTEYVWDPNADHGRRLDDGVQGPEEPPGAYTQRRDVWYGSDGRGHQESSRPVRSIPHVLLGIAGMVAEERDMEPPAMRLPDLIKWLDGQLDFMCRQDWIVDVWEDLRALLSQLKAVTGSPKVFLGNCPNPVEDTTCGARLYLASDGGETISCRACGRRWPRPEWEHLARVMHDQKQAA